MDVRNLISGALFFALAAFIMVLSLGLGLGALSNPQAGFLPFISALMLAAASALLTGLACLQPSGASPWAAIWQGHSWQKILAVAAGLLMYVAVLALAGFVVATIPLMILLFGLSGMKCRMTLGASMVSVALAYGLFSFLLKTPLPRGIWGF